MVFRITKCLGCGQFGSVHQGMWKPPEKDTLNVAVKRSESGTSAGDRVKLLQEAAIMGQFLHPNTIQLLGVVISEHLVSIYDNVHKPMSYVLLTVAHWLHVLYHIPVHVYVTIITLLCFKILQVLLVMELASKGDLKNHLFTLRPR